MYQALEKLLSSQKVWLTGNFDVPLSQTLLSIMQDTSSQEHFCVVETSSFMLYNLQNFVFDYAIWLNIARDHLDRHGTMEEYIDAKKAICENAQHCFVSQLLYDLLPKNIQFNSKVILPVVDISYTQFV